jgi:putative spermidine/putrescine transport system substrate-binding protein
MTGGLRRQAARAVALTLLGAVLGAAAAACSVGGGAASADLDGLGGSLPEIQRQARREGELTLVTWRGYADPSWAVPFERQTGCEVDVREVSTVDDMSAALDSVDWDGVSASGRVAGRLIADGRVAPLDTARVPSYQGLVADARSRIASTPDGEPYGMPFGRVPNLLLVRTDAFPDDTSSWAALWEEGPRLGSTVSLPDDPMVIADAALYLEASGPALGVGNPYELDARQLQAAVRLLRRLRPSFTSRALGIEDRLQSFLDGEGLVAMSTPAEVELLQSRGVPVQAVKPSEGTTGRLDVWMISSETEHPNCLYLWLDYVGSPSVQAAAAERLRQAPVNPTACELTRDENLCAELNALDDAWWKDVYYETTPPGGCEGDAEEGDVACATEEEWVEAWASLRQRR